jgi:hypothetical protein
VIAPSTREIRSFDATITGSRSFGHAPRAFSLIAALCRMAPSVNHP